MSSLRRNLPGTSNAGFSSWPEQSLEDMDSVLDTQQYIQQLIRRDPADIDTLLALPEGRDPLAWRYEHFRQIVLELGSYVVALQPVCTPDSCQIMSAGDQEYVLATGESCSAPCYMARQLEHAEAALNNERNFPSRVNYDERALKSLSSVMRRVYRIFAHAYYAHRDVFEKIEAERHLCQRYHAYARTFKVMDERLLIVPLPIAEKVAGV